MYTETAAAQVKNRRAAVGIKLWSFPSGPQPCQPPVWIWAPKAPHRGTALHSPDWMTSPRTRIWVASQELHIGRREPTTKTAAAHPTAQSNAFRRICGLRVNRHQVHTHCPQPQRVGRRRG